MARAILNVPYEVEQFIKQHAPHVLDDIRNHYINEPARMNRTELALADMWKRGYQAKESFGFRWGLVIGAATGGLIVCIANALGGAL